MAAKYKLINIQWDTDGDEKILRELPKELSIDSDALSISDENKREEVEETISDYLSDTYGFCHFGFKFYKGELNMTYDVKITEISIRHVTVEADSQWEAEEIAEDRWNSGDQDYILTSEDFVEAQFDAVAKET